MRSWRDAFNVDLAGDLRGDRLLRHGADALVQVQVLVRCGLGDPDHVRDRVERRVDVLARDRVEGVRLVRDRFLRGQHGLRRRGLRQQGLRLNADFLQVDDNRVVSDRDSEVADGIREHLALDRGDAVGDVVGDDDLLLVLDHRDRVGGRAVRRVRNPEQDPRPARLAAEAGRLTRVEDERLEATRPLGRAA